MSTAYDNWKTRDPEGDAWQALSEAVSVRVAEMHKDPEWIEKALNEIDCDFTDEMMALRVEAHISDSIAVHWAYVDFEKSRIAQYLLKFAKAEIEGERYNRCARTADMFANRLSNDEE